jgi:Ni2+-binding GTPase involved in maturation of urease and hydrogenase
MRFIMLGGFLGAGKTTTVSRLARHFLGHGLRVGVVTNDQAGDLVDTESLRAQGLSAEEVAGACFCCRFDELVERVSRLEESSRPDVVLAEPVGSCTDLVATVIQPLKALHGGRFEVAPYAVLFKPSHGKKILRGEPAGFSPKAAYIFRKQLEEADAIVLNRVDELTPAEADEVAALIQSAYPGVPVLRISARTGLGLGSLTELLGQKGAFGRRILDIDYDVYAEGEAELGWLNATFRAASAQPADLDAVLLGALRALHSALPAEAEVAHVKAVALSDGMFGVANLVATAGVPELSLPSRQRASRFELVVNARVAMPPEELQRLVLEAVPAVCAAAGARAELAGVQSFRPGRPTPTHRYAAPT